MNDNAPATVCPGCGRSRPQELDLCGHCFDRWSTMFPAQTWNAGGTWDDNVAHAKLCEDLKKSGFKQREVVDAGTLADPVVAFDSGPVGVVNTTAPVANTIKAMFAAEPDENDCFAGNWFARVHYDLTGAHTVEVSNLKWETGPPITKQELVKFFMGDKQPSKQNDSVKRYEDAAIVELVRMRQFLQKLVAASQKADDDEAHGVLIDLGIEAKGLLQTHVEAGPNELERLRADKANLLRVIGEFQRDHGECCSARVRAAEANAKQYWATLQHWASRHRVMEARIGTLQKALEFQLAKHGETMDRNIADALKTLSDGSLAIEKLDPKPGDLLVIRHPALASTAEHHGYMEAAKTIGAMTGCRVVLIPESTGLQLAKGMDWKDELCWK